MILSWAADPGRIHLVKNNIVWHNITLYSLLARSMARTLVWRHLQFHCGTTGVSGTSSFVPRLFNNWLTQLQPTTPDVCLKLFSQTIVLIMLVNLSSISMLNILCFFPFLFVHFILSGVNRVSYTSVSIELLICHKTELILFRRNKIIVFVNCIHIMYIHIF